jgi:hypothetical protein
MDKIVDAFYKFIDSFDNKDELIYLKEQGYNTEKYFSLIDKRRKLEQDAPFLLHEVISDINTLHEERKDFYIKKSKYFANQLAEIKKNSSTYALNEIKRNYKEIFTINKIKYGFFKARKYTKKHFSAIDLEAMFKDLVNSNVEKSNYDIIEKMIKELRREYEIEDYFFQCCLNKLNRKYGNLYPNEFINYKKNQVILLDPPNKDL